MANLINNLRLYSRNMGYFQVRYRVVNYDRRGFIRLATEQTCVLITSEMLDSVYQKKGFFFLIFALQSRNLRSFTPTTRRINRSLPDLMHPSRRPPHRQSRLQALTRRAQRWGRPSRRLRRAWQPWRRNRKRRSDYLDFSRKFILIVSLQSNWKNFMLVSRIGAVHF